MIKSYLFTQQGVQEDVPLDDWRSLVSRGDALLWVDIRSLTPDDMEHIASRFGLHQLALDSCLDHYRRPHLYEFEEHFYVNLTVIDQASRGREIKASELHLFVGEWFIITATKDKKSEAVDAALAEYKGSVGQLTRGSAYAVYLVAEDLVETYFPIVEKLDSEADELEDVMIDSADRENLRRHSRLKRQVFSLRKLLGPQRDIFSELSRRDFSFMDSSESLVYFQDVYNRMIRIFDMLDTIREILSGSLDIYLSTVSNRLNQVMRLLTAASIMLMTLALITGFYGMNFTHLPWLHSPNAFPSMLILMAALTGIMWWWFRRKGWL